MNWKPSSMPEGSGSGTTSFLPSPSRVFGATALDQERDDFEKGQLNAITKCLSLEEAAAKEKHVRTVIIGTFRVGGPQVFWQNVKDHVPLHSNDVVTWKFLVVFHRVIQDGHPSVPKASRSYCGFIDEIVNSHKQSKSAYGRLCYSYGGLIISRLLFHAKYPNIPGSLTVKVRSIVNNDAADNFELAIDFLDLLERIIKVKKILLKTFDPGKSNSSTASGQCRLSALVPCINDSARIFDLLSKTIKILHLGLPWDTLSGHRKRFRLQYSALEDLYGKLDHFHYLKSTTNIPKLSGQLDQFIADLHRMPDHPEPPTGEESLAPSEEQPSSSTSAVDGSQFEQNLITVDDSLHASLAYVQQEYSDLSVKYQTVIQTLNEERGCRERAEQDASMKEQRLNAEMESLRQQNHDMVIKHRERLEAATITAANNSTTDTINEEKLEKLKSAYQKLRSDHIVLLRQKAEVEKVVKNQQQNLVDIEQLLKDPSVEATSSMTNKPEELTDLLKRLLNERDRSVTALQEKTVQVDRLENQKRLLDLEAGERNLVMKEELEVLRSRDILKLEERVEELRQSRDSLKAKSEEREKMSRDLESVWREKLFKQLNLLSNRLSAPWTEPPSQESVFGVAEEENHRQPHPALMDPSAAANCDMMVTKLGRMQDVVFYVLFALMQLQPFEKDDDLSDLVTAANRLCQVAAGGADDDDDSLVSPWEQFLARTSNKLRTVRSVVADRDPTSDVDREISEMQQSINEAARAMEKLMVEAKANESKPNLDVDLKIIDSCSGLLASVQEMIKSARHLQREITEESGNARKPSSINAAKDLYKRDQRWSEGLISAAKDIGGGAKLFVDSANEVVHGEGKFEQLIAASQEIAGSTAQLVIASQVKAKQDSAHLKGLKTTSKSVAESTAQVIATCRACSSDSHLDANVDFSLLSVHQSKRLEMEMQIKVLQLETQLEKQREQLFDLRKMQYANSSWSASNIDSDKINDAERCD